MFPQPMCYTADLGSSSRLAYDVDSWRCSTSRGQQPLATYHSIRVVVGSVSSSVAIGFNVLHQAWLKCSLPSDSLISSVHGICRPWFVLNRGRSSWSFVMVP